MDRQERDGWTDREPPRAAHSTRGQRVALLDADNFSSWNELWMLPKTGGGVQGWGAASTALPVSQQRQLSAHRAICKWCKAAFHSSPQLLNGLRFTARAFALENGRVNEGGGGGEGGVQPNTPIPRCHRRARGRSPPWGDPFSCPEMGRKRCTHSRPAVSTVPCSAPAPLFPLFPQKLGMSAP